MTIDVALMGWRREEVVLALDAFVQGLVIRVGAVLFPVPGAQPAHGHGHGELTASGGVMADPTEVNQGRASRRSQSDGAA